MCFYILINVLIIFLNKCIFVEYFYMYYVIRIYVNFYKLIMGNNLNISI